jgi:abortive infection bacteriophage resistance protein
MVLPNPDEVEFYLQHLNYYRLSAYWVIFEEDSATGQFKSGTSFNQVLSLYIFDRELRLLLLNAIERIEVSVRTQWAYQMAHIHGSHSYCDQALAKITDHWEKNLEKLQNELNRSNEAFRLQENCGQVGPPVWAVVEVMSLGLLSNWFANLKPYHTRKSISNTYDLDDSVLQSWLHHLTILRNTCAHHSRLWNREFQVIPKQPRTKPPVLKDQWQKDSRKIFNTLLILLYFMDIIAPQHHWRKRLRALLTSNSTHLSEMGFPSEWTNLSIWEISRPTD